jgi:poly-gamma-glutamate capsule biosynthesis protein CapA/YwtB (metallophosphatase superfamily)
MVCLNAAVRAASWIPVLLAVAAGAALAAAAGAGPLRAPAGQTAAVSIGWAGDAVPASSGFALPDDPTALFAAVRPLLTAPDVMFGNLEGTLTGRGSSKCGAGFTSCYAFRSPPAYARAFAWAGYDVLNLANNHAFDFGADGRTDTSISLDAARLAHTGAPHEIALVTRRGITVAFLGFSSYDWSAPLNDLTQVASLVRSAVERADVVVVALHGGAEGVTKGHVPHGHEFFLGEDRGDLRAFARTAVDAGADLVVVSGPHVVRGMEFYRGRLVAYSVGNFVGYGGVFALHGALAEAAILHVSLGRDGRFVSGRILPVRLDGDGIPVPDASGAAIGDIRSLSAVDFGASAARIRTDGSIVGPGR